jgi:PKD repeat protein
MMLLTSFVLSPVSGDELILEPDIFIMNPMPRNNSIDISLLQSNVSVYIEVIDIKNDLFPPIYHPFLWKIGGKNITTNSSSNLDGYGRIEANILGPLVKNETYKWYVNITPIERSISKNVTFSFRTFQEGPTANFTNTTQGWKADFDGSSSYDPNGVIENYTWYFGDGNIGFGETVQHIYSADDDYDVSLNVTDNGGKHDNITKTIHIFNHPPVANFTNITQGLKVYLDGSLSDDSDGKIVEYKWEFGDGNNNTGTNVSLSHIYEEDGDYRVNLTVTDDYGKTDNKSAFVNVANAAPIADFLFNVNFKVVTFTSISSDVDGTIVNHTWYFGDGTKSYEINPVHTYTKTDETYTVTLNVTDNKGLSSEISKEVTTSEDTTKPTVKIVKPERALYFNNKKIFPRLFRLTMIIGDITIEVDAIDDESGIERVEFIIGGEVKFTAKAPNNDGLYTFNWERDRIRLIHLFTLGAKAYDNAGNMAQTDSMLVKKIL